MPGLPRADCSTTGRENVEERKAKGQNSSTLNVSVSAKRVDTSESSQSQRQEHVRLAPDLGGHLGGQRTAVKDDEWGNAIMLQQPNAGHGELDISVGADRLVLVKQRVG